MDGVDTETEFLLVRHAQSEWNAAGRWQGHADPPLSELGHAQARELSRKLETELAGSRIHRILCSDLERARQTAQTLAGPLRLSPQTDARLREIDVGSWAGLTRKEIAARAPEELARFEGTDIDVRPGGGETRRELQIRALSFVKEIARDAPGKKIMLVTHLGFVLALQPENKAGNAHSSWFRIRPE